MVLGIFLAIFGYLRKYQTKVQTEIILKYKIIQDNNKDPGYKDLSREFALKDYNFALCNKYCSEKILAWNREPWMYNY